MRTIFKSMLIRRLNENHISQSCTMKALMVLAFVGIYLSVSQPDQPFFPGEVSLGLQFNEYGLNCLTTF